MSILNFVGGIVEPIAGLIDSLVTTDDEKARAKASLTKIILDADAAMDKEITERWKADASTDSWLPKNIRPVSYATVLIIFLAMALTDGGLITVKEAYVPAIEGLLSIMTIAYFGSRGVEKVFRIKNGNKK